MEHQVDMDHQEQLTKSFVAIQVDKALYVVTVIQTVVEVIQTIVMAE
jgi:hypothetical protein